MDKNEYKEAVNKIVISDELREKIIHNSSEKKHIKTNIYKYFRRTAGMAACFALCMLSYYAITKYYHFPDYISMNTPPSIQTSDNSNSSDMEDNNTVPVIPNADDNQNNIVNTQDKQHLPNHADKIARAVNSSARPTTNNSVSTDDSVNVDNSLPISGANQAIQSNSSDTEHIEQDNFPPVLNAAPPTDSTPEENISDNENINGEYAVCAVYSEENMSDIAAIEQELGYDVKVPRYIPDDYKTDSLSAPFGEFAQITYTNETDMLYYRTAKGSKDISGDYNDYSDVETVVINDNDVTIKGNDNLYHNAGWFAEEEAFSIYSDTGVEKDTMIDIVKSVN